MNILEKKLSFFVGIVAVISILGVPDVVLADYTYDGTNDNDEIFFGYCASCVVGGPGLLVCRKTLSGTDRTEVPMDTGRLRVRGAGRNDYIQAIHNGEKLGCRFGDLSLLTYSQVDIFGESGNDTLLGSRGRQRLFGGTGNDYLSGYPGNDRIFGGPGNDFLIGDQGDDDLYGNEQDDILVGGTGDDLIDGGPGVDTFRCRHSISPTVYDGGDHATDCGDTRRRNYVERTQQSDPYEEWAFITYGKNGIIHHHLTTSNPRLLLTDRAAGASILLGSGGDMPVVGDFDSDLRSDDLAVFRPTTRRWHYDYNHNGRRDTGGAVTDITIGPWAIARDRPIAGDFDRDGRIDDMAVFRPSERTWYFDYNRNGRRDTSTPASIGTPASDLVMSPYGLPGDIPIAGDFDRDGYMDDIGIFRPSNRTWYFDYNHNGTHDPSTPTSMGTSMSDEVMSPYGLPGDIPIAGDFDRDGYMDDIGIFRLATRMWYFDYNHNGTHDPSTPASMGTSMSDEISGPWGFPGEPRQVTHKQYDNTCGPASLNIVMEHLGIVNRNRSASGQRDLDGTGTATIDLGYHLSMEHIMYEGYSRYRQVGERNWNIAKPGFMGVNGVLSTTLAGGGAWFEIRYDIGNVTYNAAADTTAGRVESWIENGPACGTSGSGVTDRGLPWVANQHPLGGISDAYPVNISVGTGTSFSSLQHLKAVIKGYIDHNTPMVLGVENGGHFNTLVGYWEHSGGFWIYTADPLDGWGRPYYGKPMRWRKIKLDTDVLPGGTGVLSSMIFFGQGTSCRDRSWAHQLDRTYGSSILCGHIH